MAGKKKTCTCKPIGSEREQHCFTCDVHGHLFTNADEAVTLLCQFQDYLAKPADVDEDTLDQMANDTETCIARLRDLLPKWHGC
jgi:hypothetical protein